ncbi:MAG: LysR family transcriptional regulator [Clostridium sp.]
MNLKEQQYVCALAEQQNITRAAEKLFISQPALSIYIGNLEKMLGVKLFERVGKRFILTYVGEKYVEKAREMLRLEEEFGEELDKITGNYTGRIRIGVQKRRAAWLLPPVLAAYEKLYPDVDVVIKEGIMDHLDTMIKKCEIDLLLCNAGDVGPEVEKYLMFHEQLLLAVPQCHPINEKAQYVQGEKYRYMDLTYLQNEDLILQNQAQSIRTDVNRLLTENHVKPGKIREIMNIETAMQMVAEGMGIGFNREGYAVNMKYTKNVNYYSVGTKAGQMDFVLSHRKDMPIMKYMQSMIDLLLERGKTFYS